MLRSAIVALAFGLAALPVHAHPALTIDCENPTFAKDTSHERLVTAFGKDNVAMIDEPGNTPRSAIFPNDPKRRLVVLWSTAGGVRQFANPFSFMFIQPSQWIAPKGVRIGTTLEQLEKLNGEPIQVAGFGGMQDGEVSLLGKLPGGCEVVGSVRPTVKLPKREMAKISGSDHFPSNHPVMRQAKPRMVEVQIVYVNEPMR